MIFSTIDLFAWCGWLTDGFKQTGYYKTLALIEWEKQPVRTIKKRLESKWGYKNTDEIVMEFDMQRVAELLWWWNDAVYWENKGLTKVIDNNNVDLIIGWPPCQAYSVAWRIRDSNCMKDDYRNYLFKNYLELVDQFQPKVFIFENVPWIFSANPNGVLIIDQLREDCKKIGYEIYDNLKEEWLFNANDFWVPQNRKRAIILGINVSAIKIAPQEALKDFYRSIIHKYKSPYKMTVKDGIFDLPKLFPTLRNDNSTKESHKEIKKHGVLNHAPRFHSKRDIEIFQELALDAENGKKKYKTSDDLIELYFQKTGKRTNVHKYHVLEWGKPSNTIPAHLHKDWLRHIHPDSKQGRSITVRESARLQSFDDDFEFLWSMWDQYKMIWNAVPPKFAKAVWNAVYDFINKYF